MLKRPYRTYGASSWGNSDDAASKAFDLAMQVDQKPPPAPVAWNGAGAPGRGNKRKTAKDTKNESVGRVRALDNTRKRQSSEPRPQSAARVARTAKPQKKNWRSRYLTAQKRLRGGLSSSQGDGSSDETLTCRSDVATWSPKSSNELQEEGEKHMHSESFDYLIQGMLDHQTVSLRCLSACSLAELCAKSSFHMFIRAGDLSSKIFAALHDADKDERLALCAATLFFILSRDGMSLDVDKDAVELLCKLMGHTDRLQSQREKDEYMQLQQRLRGGCVDSSLHGLQFIDFDNMTAADLTREAMMSFSASAAGKSVLDDIRIFGGIDNTIETILSMAAELKDCVSEEDACQPPHNLIAAGRCVRMLSNLISCEPNKTYVGNKMNKGLLRAMARSFQFLDAAMMREEACRTEAYVKCLLDILYTAQNMTNYDELTSSSLAQEKDFLDILLSFALELRPKASFRESHWECIQFMALHVLVNMVEASNAVRLQFVKKPMSSILRLPKLDDKMTSPLAAVVELCIREDAAADKYLPDFQTDDSDSQDFLGSQPTPSVISVPSMDEETEGDMIEKSGRNMKHSVTTAYATLLVGLLIRDNKENQDCVLGLLPEGGMKKLVITTRKFYHLASIAGILDQRADKSIVDIMRLLSEVAGE